LVTRQSPPATAVKNIGKRLSTLFCKKFTFFTGSAERSHKLSALAVTVSKEFAEADLKIFKAELPPVI
jgi:hypothetical protein